MRRRSASSGSSSGSWSWARSSSSTWWPKGVLVDLPLILAPIALVLYLRGMRLTRKLQPWRIVAFAGALLTLVVALEPPLDSQVDRHLWAHMTQHVLLMAVAASLLVLGAPWMQI